MDRATYRLQVYKSNHWIVTTHRLTHVVCSGKSLNSPDVLPCRSGDVKRKSFAAAAFALYLVRSVH